MKPLNDKDGSQHKTHDTLTKKSKCNLEVTERKFCVFPQEAEDVFEDQLWESEC